MFDLIQNATLSTWEALVLLPCGHRWRPPGRSSQHGRDSPATVVSNAAGCSSQKAKSINGGLPQCAFLRCVPRFRFDAETGATKWINIMFANVCAHATPKHWSRPASITSGLHFLATLRGNDLFSTASTQRRHQPCPPRGERSRKTIPTKEC